MTVDVLSPRPMATALRTVVVDDEPPVRLLLSLTLQTDDRFDLVGCGDNGEQAIEMAARLRPDLIILDRHMPVLGGIEAIDAILRRSPETAVVLYSAAGDADAAARALAAGAVCVIDKSVVTGDLLDTVAGVLAVRGDPAPDGPAGDAPAPPGVPLRP